MGACCAPATAALYSWRLCAEAGPGEQGEGEGPDVMNGAPRAAGKASGQAGPSPASHTCTYKSDTPALGPPLGGPSPIPAHV